MNPNLETTVRDFIDKHINSFGKWELVRYFYAHQLTADTVFGIAGQLQRNAQTLRGELIALAKSGILHQADFDNMSIYTLTEDTDMRQQLAVFMQACQDRQVYLSALAHIMQRLR